MDYGRTHIAVGRWCMEWRDHRTQASVAPKEDPHLIPDSARSAHELNERLVKAEGKLLSKADREKLAKREAYLASLGDKVPEDEAGGEGGVGARSCFITRHVPSKLESDAVVIAAMRLRKAARGALGASSAVCSTQP